MAHYTFVDNHTLVFADSEMPTINDYDSFSGNCCIPMYNVTASQTNCTTCYYIDRLPPTVEIILILFFVIGMVLSLIGNISVMSVLTFGRRKKRTFNAFLLNLALADWTLGILCMPFLFIQIIIHDWIFGEVMCKLVPFSLKVSEAVSIFTLTAIGIDRYYVVMYPLRPRTDNRKKKIIILVTWILATGLSAPKPWVLQLYSYPLVDGKTAHSCSPNWPSIEHKHRYDWALVIILFALPLVLLSFCYGRVARKLWLRSLPGNADPERDREQKKSKEKTVKMLISVVVLFALCWLPLNVYNIVLSYYPEYFRSHQQETRISRASVLIWLTLSDTIINPIVYVFLSDRFRKDLKNMFYQWTRRCRSDGDDFYTGGYATTSAYDTSPYTTRRTRLSPNMSSTDMGRNTNMDNTLDVSSNRNITLTVDGLPKKRSIVAGSKV